MSLCQSALVKHSQRFAICANWSPSRKSPCDAIWRNSAQRGCAPTLGTRTRVTFVALSRTIWFHTPSTVRQWRGSTGCQPYFCRVPAGGLKGIGTDDEWTTPLNPYDDGIGVAEFVDWPLDAGHPIQRIPDYSERLRRFETAMRALPEPQRQHSVLPLLHFYARPQQPLHGALASTQRLRAA